MGKLCDFGCGQEAKYEVSLGRMCCQPKANLCPEAKRQNSERIKKAHAEGKCVGFSKTNCGWAKGKTKETDERVKRNADAIREKYATGERIPAFSGKKHSEETKEHIRQKRIEFLENNPNANIKWFIVKNHEGKDIKVQGKWELEVANKLNLWNIKWERKVIKFRNGRRYTPDFFLCDYNMFIEIKGFMRERDKYKMWLAIEENKCAVKVVEDPFTLKDIGEITSSQDFTVLYPKEKIDMTKFDNVWDK